MTHATIASIETFIVSLPRDAPYLGPLQQGEAVNTRGYFVRKGNRTVYPTSDRSVIVRATATDGNVGWGETYGIVTPQAVVALIDDLLAPFVVGRDPRDAKTIWQDLYDMQRVRGASSGYYGDALAAIDIALCDVASRIENVSMSQWLGGARATRIAAYVSGLPRATLDERVALAKRFVDAGYRAIKFAAPAATDGVVTEMRALRAALGDEIDIMVDLHWKFVPRAALSLIRELAPYRPRFVEAPCPPEDIAGLAEVAAASPIPIAVGEEWHNVYEAKLRLDDARVAVVQPEIAHTGVSQFVTIARAAAARKAQVIPHATIGVGIFLAASLHASATVPATTMHEYQHSVFDRNLRFVETTMRCEAGYYDLPAGPGLGVVPTSELLQAATNP